jgi:hypothetical protein
MKILVKKTLSNDVCIAQISTSDFSEGDISLMSRFAEPEIDLGGTYGAEPDEFTLPTDLVKIKSDSPFVYKADSRDLTREVAEDQADVWAAAIVVKIKAAIDALRALSDTFTEETSQTY